jgi:hypothetical protein
MLVHVKEYPMTSWISISHGRIYLQKYLAGDPVALDLEASLNWKEPWGGRY